ncbi:MAG TPA: hypothetical protein VK056_00985 [Bacillota bacterium]|nr:hypothetical protein [Bacillota bacterium]
MMIEKYWKVVCRYGHVGTGNEVNVSRYLKTEANATLIDVLTIVSKMPGVKKGNNLLHSIKSAYAINKEEYEYGKETEKHNLYLQKLMNFSSGNIGETA